MKLIGRYDSPYVRRVGVSLHLLGIPFELQPLSPFSQANELRRVAPIGRMPALVLDNGEVLIESAAILDWLDEMSGPNRALLPDRGQARRRHLRILAASTAACDKAIAINYERRRPSDRIFDDWLKRCRDQLDAALAELEQYRALDWPGHDRPMQIEVTTACMVGYVKRVEPDALPAGRCPQLDALSHQCEMLAAFKACPELI
jgi:glutathione S-transferase